MSEELPKQELLIKLLALTASDSEGEALSAMRKANSLLATAGWTWEKLIRGKIRIIEDPFKNLQTPESRAAPASRSTPPQPQPRPPVQPRPTPPPPRPPGGVYPSPKRPSSPSWSDLQAQVRRAKRGPSLDDL